MKNESSREIRASAQRSKNPCAPLAVFLFVAVIVFLILLPPHHSKDGYIAGIIDKHRLIDQQIGQKIILVGGSNVAFGSDSGMLGKQTGLAVVNMGVHAGLGLRFMLEDVGSHLSKGDIVIIAPEYEQFGGMAEGRLLQHLQMLSVDPQQALHSIDIRRASAFAPEVPGYLQHKLNWYKRHLSTCFKETRRHGKCAHKHLEELAATPPYCRGAYNSRGDVTAHLTMQSPGFAGQGLSIPKSPDQSSVDALNHFYTDCQKKDVAVYLVFPSVPESLYSANSDSARQLAAKLEKAISIPVLSPPERFVLPDNCFFDTCYHLTRKGIDIRMEKLASDINKILNNQTVASGKKAS